MKTFTRGGNRHGARGLCGFLDGETAVVVIGGVKCCGRHAALVDSIVANPSVHVVKREVRVSRIETLKCYCGNTFRWAKQRGARPSWCPDCRQTESVYHRRKAIAARQSA
jgi:hypothetical protein